VSAASLSIGWWVRATEARLLHQAVGPYLFAMIRVVYDPNDMVEAVLRLWDQGFDTERIATTLKIYQHEAERFLHKGLEKRNGAEAKATDV